MLVPRPIDFPPRLRTTRLAATIALVIVALLDSLGAAASPPSMRFPDNPRWPSANTLIDTASDIVVGRVVEVIPIKNIEVAVPGYASPPARLLAVRLEPLVIAKGAIAAREIVVTTYAWLSEDNIVPAIAAPSIVGLEQYEVGSIHIYFLRNEDGLWRPLYDLISYRISIGTGSDWKLPLDSLGSAPLILAQVLLLPGSGEPSVSQAIRYSFGAVDTAIDLVGHRKTLEIVREALAKLDALPIAKLMLCRIVYERSVLGASGCYDNLDETGTPMVALALLEALKNRRGMLDGGGGDRRASGERDLASPPELTFGLNEELELRRVSASRELFSRWLARKLEWLPPQSNRLAFIQMLELHPNENVRRFASQAVQETQPVGETAHGKRD